MNYSTWKLTSLANLLMTPDFSRSHLHPGSANWRLHSERDSLPGKHKRNTGRCGGLNSEMSTCADEGTRDENWQLFGCIAFGTYTRLCSARGSAFLKISRLSQDRAC